MWHLDIDIAGALLIFALRLADVALGTIRAVLVMRGIRPMAAAVGFFEILIWVFAISQVMSHLDNLANVVAYAAGYSSGILLGMFMEDRMALGVVVVNIVTPNGEDMARAIRDAGFGATGLTGAGGSSDVDMIRVVSPRRRSRELLALCREQCPGCFATVEDVRCVRGGFSV
ncbi:DUF5698 domain-containing protein [Nitratidesulfovibrio liaohensis]|uniref:UPF0316 protein KPS_002665 n=1 Tax=Nitratidesulfovibrio liaohensis TaxID=2604158 RepID=A0ABY9R0E7_9BACT|nr:DUF5698 domain-containing protein [Nitratidesulfovibrio liaohensis]WMW64617.1 DUF5698 domain-containing protein [Nitratidesulfovibrio liaohensis]